MRCGRTAVGGSDRTAPALPDTEGLQYDRIPNVYAHGCDPRLRLPAWNLRTAHGQLPSAGMVTRSDGPRVITVNAPRPGSAAGKRPANGQPLRYVPTCERLPCVRGVARVPTGPQC